MKKLHKQAFTLVELIVVITILAILGTIAFISFQNYARDARNGVRIADINNIEKNLGIFITEKGFYPIPDYGTHITYSGALARTQGTVGDNVTTNLRNLSKKPVDPLIGDEYTYSVANNNVEYQVATILEGGSMVYNLPVTKQANAAMTKKATAKVKGTYNEKTLKVSTGGLNYILAVPSIINSNIGRVDLQDLINNKELVYNNYENLPDSYKNQGYTMTGGFDYNPSSIVVYTGSTYMTGNTEKLEFIDNLKEIYNGTILKGETVYREIVDIDIVNNPSGAVLLVDSFITNNVGGITGIISTTLPTNPEGTSYSCIGSLNVVNAEISNTVNLTADTNYQSSNSGDFCYYTCKTDYEGVNCETYVPPVVGCTLNETQVDTLNGYVISDSLYVYDLDFNTLNPITEEDRCNAFGIDWVGGPNIPTELWSLTNLGRLGLSSNSITSIPAEIGKLVNLEDGLALDHNLLTSLPSEIGNLTNLGRLRLDHNLLTNIPTGIWSLTNLYRLHLNYNLLTSLPIDIGSLTKLTYLKLDNNSLTSLPTEIGSLTDLWMLYLNNNSLISLPVSIGNCKKLEELYINYNSLTSLPAGIGNLTNLTRLDSSNNSLTNLPAEIGNIANNLYRLALYNNPLLGQLSYGFLNTIISSRSQLNIPTTGQRMTIGGNGTNIVITVTQ